MGETEGTGCPPGTSSRLEEHMKLLRAKNIKINYIYQNVVFTL